MTNRNPYNIRFLDPERLLFNCGLKQAQTIADLGAGSGFYALAAAKVIDGGGKVFVVDVLDSALAHIASEARLRKVKNIQTVRADLERPGSVKAIPDGSCDIVILGNVIHQLKQRKFVFAEIYRILKTGGKVVIVEWNDRPTTIGPKAEDRLKKKDVQKMGAENGFKYLSEIETDSYHYGLIFQK